MQQEPFPFRLADVPDPGRDLIRRSGMKVNPYRVEVGGRATFEISGELGENADDDGWAPADAADMAFLKELMRQFAHEH